MNLDMDGDLLINFTMSTFTAKNGRRLHIMGTKGDIMADMDDELRIDLRVFGQEPESIDIRSLVSDMSGHGGGETPMLLDLAAAIRGEKRDSSLSTLQNAIESHYICLAAEESRLNQGACIAMDEFIGSSAKGR